MSSPYDLLLELEARSKEAALGVPLKQEARAEWAGIVFHLGDLPLVISMQEVQEMMPIPELARIPGVKHWTLGIANVRGNLLPVFDLHGLLFGHNLEHSRDRRVFVFNHAGVYAGVVVNDVQGLKHFDINSLRQERPELPDALHPYVRESVLSDNDTLVGVFGLERLAQDPTFLEVAV